MSDIDNIVFSHPARVLKRAPSEQLRQAARESRALDESVFDEHPPFFFRAEMSSDRLDSYYTHMDVSSLRNFAEDFRAGVAFLDSHNSRRLPMGRSLDGVVEDGGNAIRVLADFFTIPGLKFNDATYQTTDDFINAVRAGIASDTSMGFYFHNTDPNIFAGFRCDICGGNLMRYSECPHWPGILYEVTDEQGNISRVIATATVFNARASEGSAVYDGSTPNAAIIKAEQEMDAGRLVPEVARQLETRYRIKLAGARHNWPGANLKEGGNEMAGENTQPDAIRTAALAEVRAALVAAGHTVGDDVLAFVRTLAPQTAAQNEIESALRRALESQAVADTERCGDFRELATSAGVATLAALAADGRRYREDLIAEALAEGVRAHGEKFAEVTYRDMLARADIDTIKRMRDDWRAIGDKNFPGGRQIEETTEPKSAETRAIDLAYRA